MVNPAPGWLKNFIRRYRYYFLVGVVLLAFSAVLYAVHWAIFGDSRFIYTYLVLDIAFLPIEVVVVTLVVGVLLNERDKRVRMDKMNMVIGAFFSEVGTEVLSLFGRFDPACEELAGMLQIRVDWKPQDFARAKAAVAKYPLRMDPHLDDLNKFCASLVDRRQFMLRLLENPNLLEHETFTDLLWAGNHLIEELTYRETLEGLPEADYAHLAGDMSRTYSLLVLEWLDYMKHLRNSYPYLYSLAVRVNPFDPECSAIIQE